MDKETCRSVAINPIRIPGPWRDCYALDYHTKSSEYLGDDEYGHPRFTNERSEIGEMVYQLKYRQNRDVLPSLVFTVVAFLRKWNPAFNVIVCVPPSEPRLRQPVFLIAESVAAELSRACYPRCVTRREQIPNLKSIDDLNERKRLLEGIHLVNAKQVSGQSVLLVDDLYRSGSTMGAVADALYLDGSARDVYALALSRTRTKR